MTALILLFAKAPVAGFAKTRLIPLLGADGAARLAHDMLSSTIAKARSVSGAELRLMTTPAPDDGRWAGALPDDVDCRDQGGGDLGDRMARAAGDGLQSHDKVVLIGADCPDLDRSRVEKAIASLDYADAFIHPAADGGYVLFAMRRFSRRPFDGIAWGGSTVFIDTLDRLKRLGWSVEIGDTLRDVDEPADYCAIFGANGA